MKVYTKTVSTKYAQYMKSFTESLVAQNSLSKKEAQEVMAKLQEASPNRQEEIIREFQSKLSPDLANQVSVSEAKENPSQLFLQFKIPKEGGDMKLAEQL